MKKCPDCGCPNTDDRDACYSCNEPLTSASASPQNPATPPAAPPPIQPPQRVAQSSRPRGTALGLLATFLVVIGAGMVFYFMFVFDTSVAVPGSDILGIESGRVNNIGLMADRQNGIICGFGLALFGLIIGLWDHFVRLR